MARKKYILSDNAIQSLSDMTPFAEGESVGFWEVAEEVAGAAPVQAARLEIGQARALFHMRSFYLLGVLRGAEAYRSMVSDEAEMKHIPFSLDLWSAEDFREDLETMPPEMFQRLCALLGLSVSWEK